MTKTAPLAIVLALIAAACESEYQDSAESIPDGGSPPSQGSEPEAAIAAASHLVPASDKQTAPNRSWSLTETHQEEPPASGAPVPPESRMQGFQVPEDGDNPPAPPLGDYARARAELARLEAELIAILDPVFARLDERGVTREQLDEAIGDVWKERMLLGLSLPEYHELQRRIESVVERARPLLDVPRPLTRDGRGGGEEICTTTTTVDEWGDGTIVIQDHESCRPGFPEDGGSPGGCLLGGPGCGDGPDGPGGGNGPTAFEFACANAGGEIRYNKCSCKRGSRCHDSMIEAGVVSAPCLIWPSACVYGALAWVRVMWMCRQKPCDEVNRRHGR